MDVAVLDDYQKVAPEMANWSQLDSGVTPVFFDQPFSSPGEVVTQLKDFEIIFAMRERTLFDRETLKSLPRLKLLVTSGMRNAAIDMTAATELGITVCGTHGGGPATAELAWGLILSLLRRIPLENASIRQDNWQTTVGEELSGKTLGLLGLGNLGSTMATVAAAFGMHVIAWSQNLTEERADEFDARLVTKEQLFSEADVISIHLKLSDRTRGLVGAEELALMKPTAYLVNTSRGPIVDEAALINVLREGTIAGAGIDVYDLEPLADGHPYKSLPNTVLTPHLGYVTRETYRVFYAEGIQDINAFLRNQPERVLNPDVLRT